jgi:hypothetical protein
VCACVWGDIVTVFDVAMKVRPDPHVCAPAAPYPLVMCVCPRRPLSPS